MTARVWTAGDPAPGDWPAVVGPDGVTYGRDTATELYEGASGLYVRQEFRCLPGGGATYSDAVSFADIFDDYGPGEAVREATADEADRWCVAWPAPTPAGA